MPALRWWHGRLHFPCGEMSSLATPVTADKSPAQGPLPFWLQRTSLLRWFNLSTVSFPSCACPYPSVLAVSPGEAPSCSAFIPASRIDGQSLPRGMCVSPSPGVVGIAPTPETSS